MVDVVAIPQQRQQVEEVVDITVAILINAAATRPAAVLACDDDIPGIRQPHEVDECCSVDAAESPIASACVDDCWRAPAFLETRKHEKALDRLAGGLVLELAATAGRNGILESSILSRRVDQACRMPLERVGDPRPLVLTPPKRSAVRKPFAVPR